MNYTDYIKSELLVLIPVLYFIGTWLKKSKVLNKRIPIIIGMLSVVLCVIWVVSTTNISNFSEALQALFVSFTQGVLTAGASVYFNQLYVQSKKED